MAPTPDEAARNAAISGEIAPDLDMPSERRELAKAHVTMLSTTARKVSLTLPLSADVDDFRRVMAAEAKQ